ncbi:hypothetical protein CR513_53733, partial [Mucuna pruriens]
MKLTGCKWIFKNKNDSKGNIERYKTRLVAKGFTQKEDIGYKKPFLRTIMTLVAHFDLELHQIDVKINGDIDKTIYMVQSENLVSNDSKSINPFMTSNRLLINDITNFIKSLPHVVSRQI